MNTHTHSNAPIEFTDDDNPIRFLTDEESAASDGREEEGKTRNPEHTSMGGLRYVARLVPDESIDVVIKGDVNFLHQGNIAAEPKSYEKLADRYAMEAVSNLRDRLDACPVGTICHIGELYGMPNLKEVLASDTDGKMKNEWGRSIAMGAVQFEGVFGRSLAKAVAKAGLADTVTISTSYNEEGHNIVPGERDSQIDIFAERREAQPLETVRTGTAARFKNLLGQ